MNTRRLAWILWIALFAVWFGTLDQRALIRPDEGRYAEIPREMVASGDWLTPRLNDLKYFEKPALQYWATAVGYELLGEDEWTARLWPALTGFLGILLAWYTGRRLWGPRAGHLAAAILAGTLFYGTMAHVLTLDMGLSFFLQLAWTGFILAQQPDTRASRRWMLTAWAALALAVLSKGLVALVLTGGTLVAYSLLNRDLSPWKKLAPLSGLALFLAIAAPWFMAVSVANPEFPRFFFIHEHFERFLTTVHRRSQPGWYFLYVYAAGALPWTLMLLHSLFKSWRYEESSPFQPLRFLVIWVVVTFGFFNLSSSKLPPYILPILPAMALLGGRHLAELSRRALLLHLAALMPLALTALILAPRVAHWQDKDYSPAMVQGLAFWLTTAAVVFVLGLAGAALLAWKERKVSALVMLGMAGLLSGSAILQGHGQLSPYSSSKELALRVAPKLAPGLPFYSVLSYEQTLPFYLKRTLTLVQFRGEMAFGLDREPGKGIPTVAEFKQRWLIDSEAYAIMPIEEFDKLVAEGLPMEEIDRDGRYVISRKPPRPTSPDTRMP